MSANLPDAGVETSPRNGWAALRFAAVTLLLPRGDVAGRIPIERLEARQDDGPGPAAWGEFEGELVPIYRLDDELRPVPEARDGEVGAVVVRSAERLVGLACEQVRELETPGAVDVKPLPACLENAASPVTALGLYETIRVGLVVNGADLLRHLDGSADGRG